MKTTQLSIAVATAILAMPFTAEASEVNGLVNFNAGTPAVAAEVNNNFLNVKTAVDNNHSRVTVLEQTNSTLNSRIAALEAKLASVTVQSVNGHPTVRFSGVNVQVVNGAGSTATANGTGNLVVGYDEPTTSTEYRCTIGANPVTNAIVTDMPSCSGVGGIWTNTGFKTGSHYVVVGGEHNYSLFGGVLVGTRHTSNNVYASVTGGTDNVVSGRFSSVSSGFGNVASGYYSSVSGGYNNRATGDGSSVSGGFNNNASGTASSASGGNYNNANGSYSSVSGGMWNIASGSSASVSGGGNGQAAGGNVADTSYSSILGGSGQNTSTTGQTIPALP